MNVDYKDSSIKTFNKFKKQGKYKKDFKWYHRILSFLDKFKDEKYIILVLYFMLKDSTLGRYTITTKMKTTLLVTLFYIITPFDAILDTIPFLGYLDDAFMVNLVYNSLRKEVDNYATWYYNKHGDRT
jgi:uncharacterized membrane protein YkvA (DUF1232 family)